LRRGPFDDELVEHLGTARGDDDGVAGGKIVRHDQIEGQWPEFVSDLLGPPEAREV
jgi:hypothetical protein